MNSSKPSRARSASLLRVSRVVFGVWAEMPPGVGFFAEDATIHEVLYAVLQGSGQRRDHQRGDDHTQPGLLLLGYGKEEFLRHLVDDHQYACEHHRECTVDEGTVYEDIYVVEMVNGAIIHVDPVQETGEDQHRIASHSHDGLPTHQEQPSQNNDWPAVGDWATGSR